jgi:hypothetical protein
LPLFFADLFYILVVELAVIQVGTGRRRKEMVNIGAGWHTLLAIVLVAGGAGLYFLRSLRPTLARDQDIFFAAVGLLCGGILFFQGWRLDPILMFGQSLLTGSAIFFAIESVRLRGVATEQAKREMPIVDEDRPVSRVYQAELDDLELYDERPAPRRIRGSRDSRSTYADDYYEEEPRRRPSSRGSSDTVERLESGDQPRKRRSRPEGTRSPESPESSQEFTDPASSRSARRSSNGSSTRSTKRVEGDVPRPKRSRPTPDSMSSRTRSRNSTREDGYVDYQPLTNQDDDEDNSGNFD